MIKLSRIQAGLALVWVVSLVVAWRPLAATFALSWRNDDYTHILLILPVSAALLWLQRRSLRAAAKLNLRAGSVILAAAALIFCSAFVWSASFPSDVQLAIRMFALVVWWIGSFVLCFGFRAARTALFPLLFLFALVPLPRSALDVIIAWLQQGSAWSASALFSMCGVPVMRNGTVLTISGLSVVIAKECSSIRSSSMLLVTTLVLAHLLLRSPWRKALVVCLSVPLSVAKNGLRVFMLVMLATRVNPGYMTGRLHHQGGILFFLIALLCEFAVLWILRRGEDKPPTPPLNPVKAAAQDN